MKNSAELIFADSENDANLFYATKFLVPDPVLFIRTGGKKYLILNDLEVDRGKKEAEVDSVYSSSELSKKIKSKTGKSPTTLEILAWFLKDKKVSELILPHQFPAFVAAELQKRKFKISFRADPFWKNRILKTKEEKEAIKFALKQTGKAIQKAYELLKESKIKGNKILYQQKVLTSEKLRSVIDQYLLENNCLAQNTIVAGGEQGVDPHNRGSGVIPANQTIVMDVFPRSIKSRYHADMTRTVIKGNPTPEIKKIWMAVKEAQERAIDQIKDGINGQKIHEGILNYFESKGFKSGKINGRMQGFFHGTGHGLGLDIHEPPRISKTAEVLKEGMVVTVEPGLYYAGIGGVRIEDVVYVTQKGCEVLSSCPKIMSL